MEKSFLSFHAHYPTWEPDASGREMLAGLAEFRDADPTAKGTAANQAETQTLARVVPIGGDVERLRPRPAPRVCFSTTPFAANAVAFAEGDVARDASVGARTPGFIGHGRAPALSRRLRLRRLRRGRPGGARGREVRCGESGAPAEILRVQRRRGGGDASPRRRRRDRERRLENSRAFFAPKSRPRRAGRFGFRERAARFPRGDRAGGRTLEWRRRCPLRCRRVRCRRVPRRFRIRRVVARRARGDSRARGLTGRTRSTVRDDARARTLSNETSCTTVDYEKRRRLLVAHNPSSALDVTPDASPLGFLTGAGFGIFLPPRFPSFPWSHSSRLTNAPPNRIACPFAPLSRIVLRTSARAPAASSASFASSSPSAVARRHPQHASQHAPILRVRVHRRQHELVHPRGDHLVLRGRPPRCTAVHIARAPPPSRRRRPRRGIPTPRLTREAPHRPRTTAPRARASSSSTTRPSTR